MGKLKELAQDAIDMQETKDIAFLLQDRFSDLIGVNDVPTETLRQLINVMECALINRLAACSGYVDEDYSAAYAG